MDTRLVVYSTILELVLVTDSRLTVNPVGMETSMIPIPPALSEVK